MNWDRLADHAWKYGIAGVFALVLLWFVLSNVAGAIKDHDSGTRALLRAVCAPTAKLADEPATECWK